MPPHPEKPSAETPRPAKPNSREEKLAAALRENLKRRKAQARAKASAASEPAADAAPSSRKGAENQN